jgi:Flp pilus assembly protein TadG
VAARTARDEGGAVTAEAALVLPALAAVTVAMAWLVSLGVAHVKVVDAARESARAAARGESDLTAAATGRQVAGPGARVVLSRSGDRVVATVSAPVRGPGGLFGFLPPLVLHAEAVAAREAGS